MAAPPGEPLPGLSAAELRAFTAGRALFDRAFTPEHGLGPIFNQTRCSSCHDLPTTGGHGAEPVTKVSRFDAVNGCDLLEAEGGDLLQASVVPALIDAGVRPERIPENATEAALVRAPALYGVGLVEAVPDEDILARADPDNEDGDGVSGRAAILVDGAVGRFGGKAQDATLAGFIATAARGELGLTTPGDPTEPLPNGHALPDGADPAPEPELDADELALLAAYVRFLAPPPAVTPEDPDARTDVREGGRIFDRIGCAACHVPTMITAPNASPALDRKRFRIYSDLLLHDLGGQTRDVCAPGVHPTERLTARLAGLSLRHEFMHDGSAQNLTAAIELHGGEAAASRAAFRALDRRSRDQLIAYLQML